MWVMIPIVNFAYSYPKMSGDAKVVKIPLNVVFIPLLITITIYLITLRESYR